MSASPEFEAWVDRAREIDILATAERLGARLKKVGMERVGPCPSCGGEDRFSIHPGKRVFNCGHVGGAGGDVIAMVQHVTGCDFRAAVEDLTGEPPPRGESKPIDPEIERERRDERRDRDLARDHEERQVRERKASAAERLWDSGVPIARTPVEAYLRMRGIPVLADQTADLRFLAAHPYEGYRDEDDQEGATLGSFPIMMAAIRDVDGQLIGVHRTYLSPDQPSKLAPPGDRKRNKAKKVLGNAKHGAIWLGPRSSAILLGEGIETALSAYALNIGPENVVPVAAISLGNLAGGSTETAPHPQRPNRAIQNCIPDPEKPGIILPDEVREITILGDADSDEATTKAFLMTAGRRFRTGGRTVSMCMAAAGKDFNDMLREQAA